MKFNNLRRNETKCSLFENGENGSELYNGANEITI